MYRNTIQRIIEEYYKPAAKSLYGNHCRLVHDNASVHVSAHTRARLDELGVKVRYLEYSIISFILIK